MANVYWYGGSGNWNDGATHWSNNSGNIPASTHATPSSIDDVVFDTLSNATAYTVTSDTGTNNCQNFTMGAPLTGKVTLAGTVGITVSGNLNFSGGTVGISWATSLPFTFNKSSGTQTITSNSITFWSNVIHSGAGLLQLVDNMSVRGGLTFSAGTFDATTNLTTVTFAYNNHTITATVSPTFYNLTFTSITPAKGDSLTISGGNITVTNNLTISDGATLTNRVLCQSNTVGTPRTITCTGASVNYSNVDFQDITIVDGTLGTNTSVGDCGGNTGITFTTADAQTWNNADGGSWSTAANWTGTILSRVPLPQDNVSMGIAYNTSKTVTADMQRLGKSIDWTGATWTTGLTFTKSSNVSIFGSFTLINSLTFTNSVYQTYLYGRASYILDTKDVTVDNTYLPFGTGGTYTLGGNLTIASARTFTQGGGTLTAVSGGNNYILSVGQIILLGGTLTLGSGTHLVTGTGNAFNNSGTTITAFTGTIKFTDTSNSSVGFLGNGQTYNNVWFSRGASTGNITITGSNIFNDFKDDGTAAHSILFTAASTQHVKTFTVNGLSMAVPITINSTTTGTFTLVKDNGGNIVCGFLNIQHAVVDSGKWFAYASTNNQPTTTTGSGWTFIGGVTPAGFFP